MNLVTIRDVLLNTNNNPEGWLYLPPDISRWDLDTMGAFSLDSYDYPPDSEEYIPEQAKTEGWIATLDSSTIEDIIDNMHQQLSNPTEMELFNAFVFYYENDAFIEL